MSNGNDRKNPLTERIKLWHLITCFAITILGGFGWIVMNYGHMPDDVHALQEDVKAIKTELVEQGHVQSEIKCSVQHRDDVEALQACLYRNGN